jgi:hypothetical protein
MSEIRNLLEKLDRIDERQQWDSLDAIVDQYATNGMTLQDLQSMEQAARDVEETGSGFLGGLGAAFRSAVSTEDFRVNYVLYHAGEKLGLNGMYGTDGKLRTLDGSTYRAERVRPSDAAARNIAVAQARLNILPQRVQSGFSIAQGAQGETERPTREVFFDPNARSLQGHSQERFRGQEPYVDVRIRNELTRIYTRERNVEALRDRYPNATVMKADSSGPYFTQDNDTQPQSTAGGNDGSDAVDNAPNNDGLDPARDAVAADYTANLDDFVASDERGLANNPEATGAIQELNTRLANLGFTNVQADSEQYSQATREALRDFQTAYNRMFDTTTATGNVPNTISVDGDLGPNTYRALQEVERRFESIERLVRTSATESITFKSSISKVIESIIKEELSGSQVGDLTAELIGIDKFIGAAGESFNIESRLETLINARLLVNNNVQQMSEEPTPNIVAMSNGRITAVGQVNNGEDGDDAEAGAEAGAETDGAEAGAEAGAETDGAEAGAETDGAEAGAETDAVQTGSDAGRYLAQLIHDAVEDGFIRADGNQIIERLEQVRNGRDYLDAVEAYQELYNEDMNEVLGNAAMRDTRFYPRYYEQLQRLEIPHTLPDDPRRLRGGLMSGREWDEIFGEDLSKYTVNADRKFEYILDNAQTGAETGTDANVETDTNQTFDWGERVGNTVTGMSTKSNGDEISWRITVESQQLTLEFGSSLGQVNNLMLTNVDIRQTTAEGITGFEATNNGRTRIYNMPNPGYQNLNDALAYVRDEMLEAA